VPQSFPETDTRDARPPDTRDRILDEAEALFADNGFAGTSVRDIAARADLTAASLYNHFAGKEALYAAVIERGVLPLVELMHELATGDEASGQDSEAVIRAVMQHLARRPHLPRLIHHEVVAGGSHVARLARDWVRPVLEQGVTAMKREPHPAWDAEELPLVITNWIHMVLGHFALAPLFREALDEDPLSEPMLERQTRILLEFARRVMSTRSPDVDE
jgi:AcrR family transcriptional regulator